MGASLHAQQSLLGPSETFTFVAFVVLLLLLFGRHSPLWATGIQTRV